MMQKENVLDMNACSFRKNAKTHWIQKPFFNHSMPRVVQVPNFPYSGKTRTFAVPIILTGSN